jgi:ABC-type glycerol-3-phosphate transport system substrate-binding protein
MNQAKGDGYGKKTKWEDAILPALEPWIALDGTYHAVPSEIRAISCFYNRALFEKYKLKEPTMWARFLTLGAIKG